MTDTAILEKTKVKLARPKKWVVIIHNDDVTPQDLVVSLLCNIFKHDTSSAYDIMLTVHNSGVGVAGVYPYEIAAQKHQEAIKYVADLNYRLKLSLTEE